MRLGFGGRRRHKALLILERGMWIARLQRIVRRRPAVAARASGSRLWPPLVFSTAAVFGESARCEGSLGRELSSVSAATEGKAAPEVKASPETVRAEFEESGPGLAEARSSSWRGLKALLGLTTAVSLAGVSYISYAYSTEDVEHTVKPWRQTGAATTSQDGNLLVRIQNVLYTSAYQVAVKAADLYLDLRKSIEDQVQGFAAPSSDKLLPDLSPQEQHVYTIVLDLNETLVFSDWKRERGWGTFKRPGVEAFLEKLAHYYEIVVYSDQLSFYVDPILERLDQKGCIRYRLARDATHYVNGKHFRDLSKLNRDPKKVLYISGHALENCLQPENGVPIKPWKLEENDTQLLDLLPFLEFVARQRPPDVRNVLASYRGLDIAAEFRERAKQNQRRVQERKQQSNFWRRSV